MDIFDLAHKHLMRSRKNRIYDPAFDIHRTIRQNRRFDFYPVGKFYLGHCQFVSVALAMASQIFEGFLIFFID